AEEYGTGNGSEPTSDRTATGSPQCQLSVNQGVLREVSVEDDQVIIGAIAWIIAPRPAFPNDYQGDMTGSAFVLDHGRRLLPAASAFSAAAHAEQPNTGQP